MRKTYIALALLLLVIASFAFWQISSSRLTKSQQCYKKVTNIKCPKDTTCMSDPTSSFCTCMGGSTEIREETGGQYGVCIINGETYEEWTI